MLVRLFTQHDWVQDAAKDHSPPSTASLMQWFAGWDVPDAVITFPWARFTEKDASFSCYPEALLARHSPSSWLCSHHSQLCTGSCFLVCSHFARLKIQICYFWLFCCWGPFEKPTHRQVDHIEYGGTCNFQTPLEFHGASTKMHISIPKRNMHVKEKKIIWGQFVLVKFITDMTGLDVVGQGSMHVLPSLSNCLNHPESNIFIFLVLFSTFFFFFLNQAFLSSVVFSVYF